MKKTLRLLAFITSLIMLCDSFAIGAHAEPEKKKVLLQIERHTSYRGDQISFIFYDKDGRRIQSKEQQRVGDKLVNISLETRKYNEAGLCSEEQTIGYDEKTGVANYRIRHLYTYNEAGAVLSETLLNYDFKTKTWSDPADTTTYKYDEAGNILEKNGSSYRHAYTYDKDGKRIEFVYTTGIGTDAESTYVTTYLYYENGKLKEEYRKQQNGDPSNDSYSEYSENGNEQTEISYLYENGKWMPVAKITTLTEPEKKTVTSYFRADGRWEPSEQRIIIYHQNGAALSETTYMGSQFTPSQKIEYSYDEDGNMLSRESAFYSDRQWRIDDSSLYTYGDYTSAVIDAPQTGDKNMIWIWGAVSGISACAVIALSVLCKKSRSGSPTE